jgi:hypothetical protein
MAGGYWLFNTRMKLHHLLQKCSFFLIKLAVFWPAAGLNSEPQNIE